MADTVTEKIENEVCKKTKDVVADSPIKEKPVSAEKPEKENGDVCENENGRTEETEVDAKEKGDDDAVCPVKRKSGVDASDDTPAEDVPEKKVKLDETPADAAESNGEAEVSA